MAKNRVIYNMLGVFAGPAPASGQHFITSSGGLVNTPILNGSIINLVRHLPRVQSVSYSIDLDRNDIFQLGKNSSVRSIINNPNIALNVEYLQAGILNEARLGFYVNYPKNYEPFNGTLEYPDNFNVCCVGGFITRSEEREQNTLRWPYLYRDKRNLFIAVNDGYTDLNSISGFKEIADNAKNWSVYGFGGCYLTSYRASAGVGEIPRVATSFLADNITFYTSGSGAFNPSVDPRNLRPFGTVFALPSPYEGATMPAVLAPGDITLNISSKPQPTGIRAVFTGAYPILPSDGYTVINHIGVDINDVKIQSYELTLDLNRNPLYQIGHRLPLDRKITFPIYADLTVNAMIGDLLSGSIANLFNQNDDYDITIKIRNPYSKGEVYNAVAVQYDILRSKLMSINYDEAIGQNMSVSLGFRVEIDPNDLSRGLFISGLMNIDAASASQIGDLWVTESSESVVTESADEIYASSMVVYF